jgi:hypothetical protein
MRIIPGHGSAAMRGGLVSRAMSHIGAIPEEVQE